jgi:hypothetical protein
MLRRRHLLGGRHDRLTHLAQEASLVLVETDAKCAVLALDPHLTSARWAPLDVASDDVAAPYMASPPRGSAVHAVSAPIIVDAFIVGTAPPSAASW